jgi:hypothetical protein
VVLVTSEALSFRRCLGAAFRSVVMRFILLASLAIQDRSHTGAI